VVTHSPHISAYFASTDTTSSKDYSLLSTIPCSTPYSAGLLLLPTRDISEIGKKILALEYVNMPELLSKYYDNPDKAESPCTSRNTR